jgi:hypothetical protein
MKITHNKSFKNAGQKVALLGRANIARRLILRYKA